MPQLYDTFADPVRLRFQQRTNPQSALSLTANPFDDPQDSVALNGEETLSERDVMRNLASDDRQKRAVALNAIMDMAQQYGDLVTGAGLTRLSNSGQFPDPRTQGIPRALIFGDADRQQVDNRWTFLFETRDYRQQQHPFFKIADVYHAIAFKRYQLGQEIEFGHAEAGDEIFEAFIYAAGLQWNRLWSEWQNLWSQGQGVSAMQREEAKKKARVAYKTITESGLAVVPYNSDEGNDTRLKKDVATINDATRKVMKDIYEQESPSGEQTEEDVMASQFFLLYNNLSPGYTERIRKALGARFDMANDNNSAAEVNMPIVPIGTPHAPASGWYIGIPGRKNVYANFRDLRLFDVEDPRVAGVAEGRVGQQAYRIVRGDQKQQVKAETA